MVVELDLDLDLEAQGGHDGVDDGALRSKEVKVGLEAHEKVGEHNN